jgi:hypothetical protein
MQMTSYEIRMSPFSRCHCRNYIRQLIKETMSYACKRCGYKGRDNRDVTRHLSREHPCEPIDLDHFIPRDVLLEELQASKRKYTRKEPPPNLVPQTVNNYYAPVTNNNLHIHLTPEGWRTPDGIAVNAFNDTNFKDIPLLDIVRDNIDDIEKACLECIWRIWYSKDHPENHNALFRNWHDRVAHVLSDESGRFEYKQAEEVMQQMLRWVRGLIDAEMEREGDDFTEDETEQIISGLNRVFMKLRNSFPRKDMDDVLRVASERTKHVFPYPRTQRF